MHFWSFLYRRHALLTLIDWLLSEQRAETEREKEGQQLKQARTQQHCCKMSWYGPQTKKDSYRCSWTRWQMTSVSFRRSSNNCPTCRRNSTSTNGAAKFWWKNKSWNTVTVRSVGFNYVIQAAYATGILYSGAAMEYSSGSMNLNPQAVDPKAFAA